MKELFIVWLSLTFLFWGLDWFLYVNNCFKIWFLLAFMGMPSWAAVGMYFNDLSVCRLVATVAGLFLLIMYFRFDESWLDEEWELF